MINNDILNGISWTFAGTRFRSPKRFEAAVQERQKDIHKTPDMLRCWRPNDVIVNNPTMKITYSSIYWDENNKTKRYTQTLELAAPNEKDFTMLEVLFSLHYMLANAVYHVYFEGLEETSPGNYTLYLGS